MTDHYNRPNFSVDPGDRDDMIAATLENFRIGEYGEIRAKSLLALCGLNATEIEELLAPLRIKG